MAGKRHKPENLKRLEVAFPDADEDTPRDAPEGMTNLTEMLTKIVRC